MLFVNLSPVQPAVSVLDERGVSRGMPFVRVGPVRHQNVKYHRKSCSGNHLMVICSMCVCVFREKWDNQTWW
jgi:hypothetical protein